MRACFVLALVVAAAFAEMQEWQEDVGVAVLSSGASQPAQESSNKQLAIGLGVGCGVLVALGVGVGVFFALQKNVLKLPSSQGGNGRARASTADQEVPLTNRTKRASMSQETGGEPRPAAEHQGYGSVKA